MDKVKVSDFEYRRPDIAAVCDAVDVCIKDIKAAQSVDQLMLSRDRLLSTLKIADTMGNLAYIRASLDVNDEFYKAEQKYFDEESPKLSAKMTDYCRALVESPYKAEFSQATNPLIAERAAALCKVMDERIIDDSIEENKLKTEYSDMLANLTFMWEGKSLTMSEMECLTKSPEREVRKAACKAMGETLNTVQDRLDDIFDKLVAVRTKKAQKLGYKNYAEMGDIAIGHITYTREQVRVFRQSVLNDVVPALTRLKTELSKTLGISGIHYFDKDVYLKRGNVDPKGTAQDLFNAAQTIYDDMNKDIGEFFRSMCACGAIDFASKKGKRGGGFATMLETFNQPFIFANFNGTMDDVGVLTHELGHAYAYRCAADNNIDYELSVGGMEVAETHSMAMEALCNNYNAHFYGERAEEATYQQIFDAFAFIPYGVIVDYFQELVYEKPDMSPKARRELWKELEREFRPWLDFSDTPFFCDGGAWQIKHHIYEYPFYYIDYCLASCLALQIGELAAVDFADAFSRYKKFVDLGGTKKFDELAHIIGLNSAFDKDALQSLSKSVESRLNRLAESIG